MKIYVMYDSKGECYEMPNLFRAKGDAIRACVNSVNSAEKNNVYSTNPEDFTLFEVGEYDQKTGNITVYEAKQNLGCLIEFKKEK